MSTITVSANAACGQMKPMHAVNNGPVYKFTEDQRITNIDAFREVGIPYARTHDASFYPTTAESIASIFSPCSRILSVTPKIPHLTTSP